MADRIRTTISLEPHVFEVFKRMAEASGMSVSRAMGDWLGDTSEAAELAAKQMQRIRRSPQEIAKEHDRWMGVMTNQVLDLMEKPPRRWSAKGAPSSNTGLKSPKKG